MALKLLQIPIKLTKVINNNSNISNTIEPARLLWTTSVLQKVTRSTVTTVDTAEVDKHTKQMEVWWNQCGSMKGLHAMNEVRVPFIRDGLVHEQRTQRTCTPLLKKKILDVGCGGGILCEPLAKLGAEVTGIDASKELIDLAHQHSSYLGDQRPTYCHTTIEDHSNNFTEYYDAVVASEIIEHVTEKELFIKSCVNVLKPNGKIFFTTPNKTKLARLTGIYMAENVFNVVPKGTHEYEKFITPTELSLLLEKNNCQVEIVYGMFYSILSNRWFFIKSQVLQYALQAVKLK